MKKSMITALAFLFAMTAGAQNVTRDTKGNYQAIADTAITAEPTPYTYTDKGGKVWPVYATKEGKHYVIRTSAKTGKKYRYYLNTERK